MVTTSLIKNNISRSRHDDLSRRQIGLHNDTTAARQMPKLQFVKEQSQAHLKR